MLPQKVVLVSGWAHPAEALAPLKKEIGEQAVVVSLDELYQKGETLSVSAPQNKFSQDKFSRYALGLAAFVEELRCQCVLIGWSMGGMVALESLGLLNAVTSVVLISSTSRFCNVDDYTAGVSLSALKALRLDLKRDAVAAVGRFYTEVYGTTGNVPAEIFSDGDKFLNEGLWYLEKTDLRSTLHRVTVPLLVVHGSKDQIVPLHAGEFLVERIPGASLQVIEGGRHGMIRGHGIGLGREQEIGECIRKFLKE